MKILIAHNDYGKFSGEEQAIQTLAAILQEHGHTVFWYRRTSATIGASSIQKIKAFFSGIYNPFAGQKIKQIIEQKQPDLIQVQNIYPFLSPSIFLACAKAKKPVVMRCPNYRLFCPSGLHLHKGEICEKCADTNEIWCVLRNCEQSLFKSSGYALRNSFARISKIIVNNVKIFIVLSEFQKQKFVCRGIPENKIRILPNTTEILPEDQIQYHPGEIIGFVGRLSKEKGIYDFFAAARQLPELKFAVAGSAPDMEDIKKQAPSNVEFKGFLKGSDLDEFYKQCKMLIFPSLWFEGFPNVITKAMVHARPIITTRIGALPEIVINGENGLLFEPGNTLELAQKIKYLCEQPELCQKMGEKGRKIANDKYSPEKYYSTLINIYKHAMK